jgi:hypothetical protein
VEVISASGMSSPFEDCKVEDVRRYAEEKAREFDSFDGWKVEGVLMRVWVKAVCKARERGEE